MFAMAATSPRIFTINEAKKFGVSSGTICILFVSKGEKNVFSKAKGHKGKQIERKESQKERTEERIKVKENLDKISAVSACNLVFGQEIILTRCVSARWSTMIKTNSNSSNVTNENMLKHSFLENRSDGRLSVS